MKVFDFISDDDISRKGVLDISLPLVHSRPSYRVKDILQKKKLEQNPGDDLLYFFYARPARRFKEPKVPVVFIVEPILDGIKRIYPFDSGAYKLYIENGRLEPKIPISDYELQNNNFFTIQQYVNAIFGSNHNYYYGRRKADDELPDSVKRYRKIDSDLNNLLNLIAEKKKDGIDDRRKTVEIQSVNDYELSGKLKAVIYPNGGNMNDPDLHKAIIMCGCKKPPLPYSYKDYNNAEDPVKEILYKTIEGYYANKGYITSGDNYED